MQTTMLRGALALVLAAALVPAVAGAQQPTRRGRQTPIEIRGQVPTPQVVTVRPREMPAYSRQVISPTFYDRNFWPTILPGYSIVPQRMLTGQAPVDSALLHGDGSSGMTGTSGTPMGATTGTPPQGMTVAPPPGRPTPNLRTTAPATRPRTTTPATPTRPDTTRGTAGTPPAPAHR